MVDWKILIAIGIYLLLLVVDIGLNFVALFIPGLGAIAETLTEGIIEATQVIIVLFIAFAGGKK